MSTRSDKEILGDLRSSDRRREDQALKALYQAYWPLIRHYVLQNSGNEDEAQDLFQDSLVVLYQQVKEGLEIQHSVKAYLYSVARYRWLHKLRDTRPTDDIDDMPDAIAVTEDMVSILAKEERSGVLARLISKLGETCQKLLTLFYFEKVSYKIIKDRLELDTEGQAKTQKYRCLKQLREMVKNNPEISSVLRDY